LWLRYEQLHADPDACFRKTLHFLGSDINESRFRRAVHMSSFEKLNKMEEQEKRKNPFGVVFSGTEKTTREGFRFMNKGVTFQDLTHIDAQLDAAFDEKFSDLLEELHYK